MSTYSFSIPLGSVDVSGLNTDDEFLREAQRLLPGALTQIGEKAAEVAWNELQKSFRGIPGFKANSSSSDKSQFIRQAGEKHRRNASTQDRRAVAEQILRQLREMNRKAG